MSEKRGCLESPLPITPMSNEDDYTGICLQSSELLTLTWPHQGSQRVTRKNCHPWDQFVLSLYCLDFVKTTSKPEKADNSKTWRLLA